jgi:hypothetical protein
MVTHTPKDFRRRLPKLLAVMVALLTEIRTRARAHTHTHTHTRVRTHWNCVLWQVLCHDIMWVSSFTLPTSCSVPMYWHFHVALRLHCQTVYLCCSRTISKFPHKTGESVRFIKEGILTVRGQCLINGVIVLSCCNCEQVSVTITGE